MREHDLKSQNSKVDVNQVLEKKLRAYAEFLAATLKLKDAFKADDMGTVEQLTIQRENMICLVNGLDHQISQSDRDDSNGEKRTVITDALNKLLQRIIQANKDCESLAKVKCDFAKRGLTTVRNEEKAMSLYAINARGIPKFLDLRT